MHRTARLAFVVSIAFALLASLVGAETPGDLTAELDRIFADACPADEPGAAVIVTRDGKTILRKAYGMADLELGVALEPDMVFRLGSITKQFTAVAILMLEQEGKLKVSDDVTRHLPGYPTHGKTITIEHLLTHTSGIPSYTSLPGWMEKAREDLTVDELIAFTKDLPLEFDPGSRFRYNNSGYILLGAIIEAVSGMDYASFVEQRIFGPLGMDHSDYGSNSRIIPRRARGYHRDQGGYVNAPYLSMTQPYSAGALLANVDDLARWDAALYTDTLLPPAALARAWKPYQLADGESAGYGYGWQVGSLGERPVISHGGGIFGFATMAIRLPEERIYVAVLSNIPGDRPDPGGLAQRVASALCGEPHELEAVDVDPAILDDYTGVYRINDSETRVVTVAEGRLFTQRTNNPKLEALPMSEDTFFYEGQLTRFWFVRGEDGEISHMVMQPWGAEGERAERTDEPLP
ncbi:MAG: serine hydrolase [bacterium]|nr:serine hydrolase [bacterium]